MSKIDTARRIFTTAEGNPVATALVREHADTPAALSGRMTQDELDRLLAQVEAAPIGGDGAEPAPASETPSGPAPATGQSGTLPTVHAAMASVMKAIGAVGKGDWNDHQKFNFRGIDSITNAVYGPMCAHGVIVVPSVLESHYAEVTTSQGKPSRQATLTVRYRFYGPAGDHVDAVTVGEAMDSADKATSKAMAAAFKYALLQTFAIPTEGQDDADAHSPERGYAPAPPAHASKDRVDALVEEVRYRGQQQWVKDQGFPWPWTDAACDAIGAHLLTLATADDAEPERVPEEQRPTVQEYDDEGRPKCATCHDVIMGEPHEEGGLLYDAACAPF